jgi:hypothetical protein
MRPYHGTTTVSPGHQHCRQPDRWRPAPRAVVLCAGDAILVVDVTGATGGRLADETWVEVTERFDRPASDRSDGDRPVLAATSLRRIELPRIEYE